MQTQQLDLGAFGVHALDDADLVSIDGGGNSFWYDLAYAVGAGAHAIYNAVQDFRTSDYAQVMATS
ncbi:MAG TPA: hypothetical protein VFL93_02160 [Longimicrobiaceae bacterium]|nr:hypothetical protein [Longimicrobiaceae bacterium]